jgi:uncharacterized protein (DUF433 family)
MSHVQSLWGGMKVSEPVVCRDPEIMSGTPVFVCTRVPVRTLFDHLEAGQPLSDFLQDFPTVSRELALAVIGRGQGGASCGHVTC